MRTWGAVRWWAARAAVVLGGLAVLLGCYEPGRAQAQSQGANGERPAAITVKVGWDAERQEVTVVCDVTVVAGALPEQQLTTPAEPTSSHQGP
ncbi:hypothetical protein ACFV06_32070 [Streptomyces sp. NPDC059618]|uniref:hypothetical protein n=1 Tax=Streptomyces sp. NPDC059618 TaxID=3346887 RepID=UPI0036BC2CD5